MNCDVSIWEACRGLWTCLRMGRGQEMNHNGRLWAARALLTCSISVNIRPVIHEKHADVVFPLWSASGFGSLPQPHS